MINGLIGTHLATGQDVSVSLNAKEMQLECDKTDYEKYGSKETMKLTRSYLTVKQRTFTKGRHTEKEDQGRVSTVGSTQ